MDLVIDHSVQVDVARSENAVQANMELEFQRNRERFAFLKWGSSAFHNMLVIPPGSGIVHQVVLLFLFVSFSVFVFSFGTSDKDWNKYVYKAWVLCTEIAIVPNGAWHF